MITPRFTCYTPFIYLDRRRCKSLPASEDKNLPVQMPRKSRSNSKSRSSKSQDINFKNCEKDLCWSLRALCILFSIYYAIAIDVATVPNQQFVFEDTLYFEIIWPETLRYTYKIRLAQNFGPHFTKFYPSVELVLADPEEACQDLYNNMKGAVAFVVRGGCSFMTKARIAERAGAIATIIADNDVTNDNQMIDMVDDNTDRTVSIPAAFLLGKDGDMIKRHLNAVRSDKAIISIPVNLTGRPLTAAKRPPWTVW